MSWCPSVLIEKFMWLCFCWFSKVSSDNCRLKNQRNFSITTLDDVVCGHNRYNHLIR